MKIWQAWAAFAAAALVATSLGSAVAQAPPKATPRPAKNDAAPAASPTPTGAPPLAANEMIAKSKDGCGQVVTLPRNSSREAVQKIYDDYLWHGACVNG